VAGLLLAFRPHNPLEKMMVKKLKALSKSDDKQLAEVVRASAQQIWQAGLGAFAKAQKEGGHVFANLVKEGTDLQKRTKRMGDGKVSEVSDTVTKAADSVSKQAAGSWDKLEQVFEDRVARSLKSLGVPTQKDIQALTRRIDELSKALASSGGRKATSSSPSRTVKAENAVKAVKAAKPAKAVKSSTSPAKAALPKKAAARKAASKKAAAPRKPTARKTAASTAPAE
jgi:poly(hydroxyalkanoate) granule-associated protein